ncbi:MAG: glycosyltransferase family 39 protein [Fimbriimonadaceae bacterium]|nr:glycosyltransferase family 39 protein [Fimbriimonadaceae bacterium]
MKNRWPTVVSWLAALIPFVGFWTYGLTDLDEGFYGAVVADMLRRHDWITPTLNGAPWFEKPVLSYWLAMPSVAAFGGEFGARLPSVVCTLAAAWVMARFARRHFGEGVALVVPVAYTGSLLAGAVGRMMMTDPALVLCLTAAFTTFYDSLVDNPRRRLWTAFWLGLAVLAKGPVGLVLFALLAACIYWKCPSLRARFKGYWAVGTLIVVLVAATWYVPCYLVNGQDFVQKFLVEQNIGRFAGGDKAHAVPLWAHPVYYPATIFLALLPWWAWGGRRFWATVRDTGRDQAMTFLWLWGLVIVGFFTVSGSKLPHYALPAVLPLTTLMVAVLVRDEDALGRWLPMAAGWACTTLALAQGATQDYQHDVFAEVQAVTKEIAASPEPIILFRITGDGKNKAGVNESSHPSQLFYLRRLVTMTDDPVELTLGDRPSLVMTRSAAFDEEVVTTLVMQGWQARPVTLRTPTTKYMVYRIQPVKD